MQMPAGGGVSQWFLVLFAFGRFLCPTSFHTSRLESIDSSSSSEQ